MTEREFKRAQRIAMYGSNIPKSGQRAAYAQAEATAVKRKAAIDAGFTPPTAAATGDLLKRRLELFKGMQDVGREEAAGLAEEASGLGISRSGFRQALNRIPVAGDTTPDGSTPSPATTRPVAPEPISKIGGVPASEALAALRGRATAEASKIKDPDQREAAMPFGPTSEERYTAAQVLKEKLAGDKIKAGLAGSELPAISTEGLRPYTPTTPTKPTTPTTTTPTTPTDRETETGSDATTTSDGGLSPTAAGLLLKAPNIASSVSRRVAKPFYTKATNLLVDAVKATTQAERARELGIIADIAKNTSKTGSAARETYRAATATQAAAEAAAYGKAARLTKQAARPELIGNVISKFGKVGKFGKLAGKLAVPVEVALNVIEGGRLIGDEEFRARRKSEFEDYANQGALRSAAESALNPVSGIYTAGSQMVDAAASAGAAKRATSAFDKASAINKARLKYLSDIGMTPDKLKAMTLKERSEIMRKARKIARK